MADSGSVEQQLQDTRQLLQRKASRSSGSRSQAAAEREAAVQSIDVAKPKRRSEELKEMREQEKEEKELRLQVLRKQVERRSQHDTAAEERHAQVMGAMAAFSSVGVFAQG